MLISRLNWHEKCHEDSENFTCNKCGLKFKWKFTLERHLQDDQGGTLDSMEENILNHFEVSTKTVDVDSISPVITERGYQCVNCKKIFRLMRYVDLNHNKFNAFQCQAQVELEAALVHCDEFHLKSKMI